MKKNTLIMNFTRFVLLTLFILITITTGCAQKGEEHEEHPEEQQVSNIITLSPKALKEANLEILNVTLKNASTSIDAVAEVKVNQDRVFNISALVNGQIVNDNLKLGNNVNKGQVVAVIKNSELPKIYADFVHQVHENQIAIKQAKIKLSLAKNTLDREKKLLEEGISSKKDFLQAEGEYTLAKSDVDALLEKDVHIKTEAKSLLGAYGIQVKNFELETILSNIPVTAKGNGIVTAKNINLGSIVTPGDVIYEISDFQELWLDISVYPNDIKEIKLGQRINFIPDALPTKIITGKIDYIQPVEIESSKTFIVRAFLNNPDNLLKPGMFGKVKISSATKNLKPYLSQKALQTYGNEAFVFKVIGDSKFEKKLVKFGPKVTDGYFVESGVSEGDRVVGKGSFILKSEILKNTFAEEE